LRIEVFKRPRRSTIFIELLFNGELSCFSSGYIQVLNSILCGLLNDTYFLSLFLFRQSFLASFEKEIKLLVYRDTTPL
jgi:hypothetical protein